MPVDNGVFVSLADVLRPQAIAPPALPVAESVRVEAPVENLAAWTDVARDVRVFRAQLADAFDTARDRLLCELAYAVLGRELLLAPPDLATIATRVLREHADAQPLRLRVAPADLPELDAHQHDLPPVVADASLAPGDAIVELACGSIDARLGIRLAAVLESMP